MTGDAPVPAPTVHRARHRYPGSARAHRRPSSGARRRSAVLVDLVGAAAICLLGYRFGSQWLQVHEARWVVAALRLCGVSDISDVLPAHLLVFRSGGAALDAYVTPSCSAILSIVGLTALTVAVLRSRRLHAVLGLLAAVVAVVVANDVRMAASALAGLWWGENALILFHDWVGTVWNLAATLGGFLLMVCLALPAAERAEQDIAGRHTARRPTSWARPGLGYRLPEWDAATAPRRVTLTGLLYRYVLPRRVSRRLGARRETGRIDYRVGHLLPPDRIRSVRALVADGLGAHAATLLAVATYDDDPQVLDGLAEAVAARQWEPVTNHRVAALRLWARGWLQSGTRALSAGHGGSWDEPLAATPSLPPAPGLPRARHHPAPRSFARPAPAVPGPVHLHLSEDAL